MSGIAITGGSLEVIGGIASAAILIMGCLAVAGVMTGPNLGWITLGLGVGGALLLGGGGLLLKDRFTSIVSSFALYFIVIGALGGTGIMSSVSLGWAMIAPTLLIVGCVILGNFPRREINDTSYVLLPNVNRRW